MKYIKFSRKRRPSPPDSSVTCFFLVLQPGLRTLFPFAYIDPD